MKLYNLKMLTVTCEILAKPNVIDILNKHNVSGHTSYEVYGQGSKGTRGPGFQNEKNTKIEVILDENTCNDILEEIARTMFSDFVIILYVSDVGVVRSEKFT